MRPLSGYPTSIGSSVLSIFPHAGPSSYAQVTTGPLAGGDSVTPGPEAGVKYADQVIGGITDSGLYRVEAIPPVGNPSTSQGGAPALTYKLRWTVVATGAEVANAFDLDAEIVRLTVIGPK